MKRIFTSYTITGNKAIKDQVLNFGNKFGTFCFLDNHDYNFKKSYNCLAGVGVVSELSVAIPNTKISLEHLDSFKKKNSDWIFGHLSYDAKNQIEELSSSKRDRIGFPEIFFFVPEIVLVIDDDFLRIGVFPIHSADNVYQEIISSKKEEAGKMPAPVLNSRYSKKEYEETVRQLQNHISKGDCYEINFCQEFYAANSPIDPLEVYSNLGLFSPNPFSAYYKYYDKFLMCASPERYLKKEGNVIISQPIKGTSKRVLNDPEADTVQKEMLKENEKERSENIMIVDLVRNDLSKVCVEGSVKVEDFLRVYTFPQVHQMISTVTGILKDSDTKISDIFRATFPMGSMTGAPKKRVMELIEKYEKTKRGLFSGTVGYIDPQGNFDFNVVIRSVQFNSTAQYVLVIAGSAITHNSNPEQEYEECLLKISAMKKALG